jgi:O-antigen/teichoic acid export membrane protein
MSGAAAAGSGSPSRSSAPVLSPSNGRGVAIERQALSLWTANAIDYALQFLLPIVLARTLDVDSFGKYRLLWLSVATVMALVPLAMPHSLYYFLPRSDAAARRLYINQTLGFLAFTGMIAAWAVSPWDPWLPRTMREVSGHAALVPTFVLLWAVASLLDLLPTVDERVSWQARATVGLSALRAGSLSAAALLTRDLDSVLLVLLAFVAFKVVLLLAYVQRYHGLGGPLARRGALVDQVRYAVPFGLSGALHGLRGQADQWVAAAIFQLHQFAAFSVGTVLGPMVTMFRQSFNYAFLPSMSRMQAAGDVHGMLRLNNRANMIVGAAAFPLLAFSFVFAEPLITAVYTGAYVDAVPVMRVYSLTYVAFVVELNSILLLFRQGPFAMRVNFLVLLVGVPSSLAGALIGGLPGAAAGSVAAIFAERAMTLLRVSSLTGVPVRRLQEWAGLGALLGAAACSAALAGWLVGLMGTHAPLARLAEGAAVVALVYPVALVIAGQRRLLSDLIGLVLREKQPAPDPQPE